MTVSLVKQSQFYFIFSFAVLTALGTLILKLPVCYQGEGTLSWIDALFTATSASCITGLTTVDIAEFSLLGQVVVMLLMQLGGIGFMTLTASIIIFLGRGMSFGNTMMMSNLSDNFSMRRTEGLLKTVVSYVFAIEAAGAAALTGLFLWEGRTGFWQSVWNGIFLAVSSFCNAGFAPMPDSLADESLPVRLVVMTLIVLGGIGIYVIYDLTHFRRRQGDMLKIHTRLVLITSAVLIVAGALGLRGFEYWSGHDKFTWMDAFFQSVSARTAGFYTVPVGELSQNSSSLMIVLMMIGGSPGSMAGGMKTTVVALAFLALINTFTGNPRVLIARREIPMSYVLKSFTIIVTFVLLVLAGAAVMNATLGKPALDVLFEAASALSTTGLSSGIAPGLPVSGKVLLIVYMFIGRIGPFTIFLFLLGREKVSRISYPEERIIIG